MGSIRSVYYAQIAFVICCLMFVATAVQYVDDVEPLYKTRFVHNTVGGKVFIKRSPDFEFRIISSNVRVAMPYIRRYAHEKSWEDRKVGLIEALRNDSSSYPTLIGVQEAKHGPLKDIIAGLNNGTAHNPYTHYGVGRDDGKKRGEYAAIIYLKDEWELVNGTYRWLAEDTLKPEVSWGAATKRIATFTTFKHKETGTQINYINTHFDQKSVLARTNSANLLVGWIQLIPNDFPTFLSGDFNSLETGPAYQIISANMADTNLVADNQWGDNGDTNFPTYTGFEPNDKQNVIDFIFGPKDSNTPTSQVVTLGHEVLSNDYNGFKFSDHRPISSHFKFRF